MNNVLLQLLTILRLWKIEERRNTWTQIPSIGHFFVLFFCFVFLPGVNILSLTAPDKVNRLVKREEKQFI